MTTGFQIQKDVKTPVIKLSPVGALVEGEKRNE